ncbi:VOC family protein [Bradyrhizobium sp. BRP22]|uniref:VOC family protein n=1 Tax=Bradyrhizobium sp. BRP22 TaxID=2793821 RepID=UPI001CD1FC7F|nr:VOC family protein [Bradyrhizobium sp. BRP22]MCA1453736.1 VOC family protein [Bradyrhizobium sp. BRP22]
MITTLDHTNVLVHDLDTGIATYREVLAREPAFRARNDGIESAFFILDNATLRVTAPNGEATFGARVRAALAENGEGLSGLDFAVDDIEKSHRRLRHISLEPDEVTDITCSDLATGTTLSWKGSSLPAEQSHGVPISFSKLLSEAQPSAATASGTVRRMDLVVVATDEPERAMALYGARLGLDLIFDRTDATNKSRLMQFACGDMLIEIVNRPTEGEARKPDRLWGIAWSVDDADAARERLSHAGRNVSDVKAGAKPGTRVFTLRDGTCNVPTLFVQHLA